MVLQGKCLAQIGQGGFGQVLKVQGTSGGPPLALKWDQVSAGLMSAAACLSVMLSIYFWLAFPSAAAAYMKTLWFVRLTNPIASQASTAHGLGHRLLQCVCKLKCY